MTNEMNENKDTNANSQQPATAPAAERRSGTATALAATGIAVGSLLLLGLTFGGGVFVGTMLPHTALPDRGPGHTFASSEQRERFQERLQERLEERLDERLEDRQNRQAPEQAPDQG